MITSNRMAYVQVEISFHQTIEALKQHSLFYAADRIDQTQIDELQNAVNRLKMRKEATQDRRANGVKDRRTKKKRGSPTRRNCSAGRRKTDIVGYWLLP